MGLFDRFKRKPSGKASWSWGGGSVSPDMGDNFIRDTAGGSSFSLPYLPIREDDARNSSIVASVASWAMRNVVQATARVEQENAKGEFELVPKHLATAIIRNPQGLIRPEDRTRINYRRMLRVIAWSQIFDGNAYLLKVRNGNRVIGLDWIPHTVCKPITRPRYPSIIDKYEISSSHGNHDVDPADMIHFTQGVDPARPAIGCSALKSVMRLVMTDNQIAIFSHAVLRNPFPGMIVMPGDKDVQLQAEDLNVILENLKQVSSGERGAGTAAFTDFLKVEKLGFSPDDMAIRELSKLPEERITAVFGIPASVCGMGAGLDRTTFANFSEAREAAYEEFMVPLWDDIADTFTEQLLPDFQKNPEGFRISFDYSKVRALQEDSDKLHQRAREDFKANIYDRARTKTILGDEPDPEDIGVYSYQLRPAPPVAPADANMAQGKAVAREVRAAAEGMA